MRIAVTILFLFSSVPVWSETLQPPAMPECEGLYSLRFPQPAEYIELLSDIQEAVGDIQNQYSNDKRYYFIDFELEPQLAECVPGDKLVLFNYELVLVNNMYGVSTAPRRCHSGSLRCASAGAIANVTIDVGASAELIQVDTEQMTTWIAARAICFVELSQRIRNKNNVPINRIERCVSELVGIPEHLHFYETLLGGESYAEAGRYLAWLQGRYPKPWTVQ